MTKEQLKKKVYETLKNKYFNGSDDSVDVSDGPEDSVHLVIISRKFDGKRLKDKNNLIWSQLMRYLTSEEWSKVTLSIGASPEEIKVF